MDTLCICLLGATIAFTILFLGFILRGETPRISTDLGGFGGGFGGWEFNASLAFLMAAIVFGACFTLAVTNRKIAEDAGTARRLAVAENRAADELRALKRSMRDVGSLRRHITGAKQVVKAVKANLAATERSIVGIKAAADAALKASDAAAAAADTLAQRARGSAPRPSVRASKIADRSCNCSESPSSNPKPVL
jgi:hypothetical protein